MSLRSDRAQLYVDGEPSPGLLSLLQQTYQGPVLTAAELRALETTSNRCTRTAEEQARFEEFEKLSDDLWRSSQWRYTVQQLEQLFAPMAVPLTALQVARKLRPYPQTVDLDPEGSTRPNRAQRRRAAYEQRRRVRRG